MQSVEGDVLRLQCAKCGAAFPTFVFAGDTDMATMGLETATSLEPISLVLGKMTNEELNLVAGHLRFAERMSQQFGRNFSAISVIRRIRGPSAAGLSFQHFREIYRPDEPIYACPQCAGESSVVATQSATEFREEGGDLLLTSDLTLEWPPGPNLA